MKHRKSGSKASQGNPLIWTHKPSQHEDGCMHRLESFHTTIFKNNKVAPWGLWPPHAKLPWIPGVRSWDQEDREIRQPRTDEGKQPFNHEDFKKYLK